MPDPSRHAADRNWIESILRYIPGFRGYLEQEYRRESDHLLRQHLAERVQLGKRGLDDYLRQLADAARLDDLPAFERVRARLDGLASRIKSAERGYSGMFDFVRIREDELDALYQLDSKLVTQVDGLVQQLTHAPPAEVTPSQRAQEFLQLVDAVEQAFGQRAAILRGTDG